MELDKKQIMLLVFIICLIVTGVGIIIWQKVNDGDVITDLEEVSVSVKESVSDNRKKEEQGEEKAPQKKKIIIHIAGAVNEAGVYELEEGARVIDALKLAGGETEAAELDHINLAAPIFDSDKIFIPRENSDIENNENGGQNGDFEQKNKITYSQQTDSSSSKINLNRAGKSELEQLPGIGPSKAANIIKYREKIGNFSEFVQLLNVSGIGEKTLDKIVTELTLR